MYGNMDPLRYRHTPDVYDPELDVRRRRANEDISRSRLNDVNEVARAGLLGSGTAFDILGEGERRGLRQLEDVDDLVFGKQREQGFQLYRDQLNWKREQERMKELERQALLQSLGDIGGFLGGTALNMFTGGAAGGAGMFDSRMMDEGFIYPTASTGYGTRRGY